MPALCFTHFGSLYKNKPWIYKQHFYIGIYITGKTHEGVACKSKATKLNKKYNKSCYASSGFQKIDIKIFIQNWTFSEMKAYDKNLMEKLFFSLVGNCSDFPSLSASDILMR